MDLDKLLNLAHLSLSEEEKGEMKKELEKLMSGFESLSEVDTKNVKPLFNPGSNLKLRKDDPEESLNRESVFEQAPEVQSNQFQVPPVIQN